MSVCLADLTLVLLSSARITSLSSEKLVTGTFVWVPMYLMELKASVFKLSLEKKERSLSSTVSDCANQTNKQKAWTGVLWESHYCQIHKSRKVRCCFSRNILQPCKGWVFCVSWKMIIAGPRTDNVPPKPPLELTLPKAFRKWRVNAWEANPRNLNMSLWRRSALVRKITTSETANIC